MGVLFKSAIGLGAVYFAMFAPALKSEEVAATAGQCAGAARLQLEDSALRAQFAAAGCVLSVAAQAQKLAPAPAAPARAAPKRGALTEADLAEPWFGPAAGLRKSPRRG